MLSIEGLRELLDYDPLTGNLIWRMNRGGTARAGSVAGVLQHEGYIYVRVDGKQYSAHRVAWFHYYGEWPTDEIDHINWIKSDNRIANMRDGSHSQNEANKPRNPAVNTSGFKGVHLNTKEGRWQAQIRHHRKTISLGCFDTPEAAHAAYCEAAVRIYGEFARVA